MRFRSWARVPLLVVCCSSSLAAENRSPCAVNPTQPGWHVFVEKKNRFCFEYPPLVSGPQLLWTAYRYFDRLLWTAFTSVPHEREKARVASVYDLEQI